MFQFSLYPWPGSRHCMCFEPALQSSLCRWAAGWQGEHKDQLKQKEKKEAKRASKVSQKSMTADTLHLFHQRASLQIIWLLWGLKDHNSGFAWFSAHQKCVTPHLLRLREFKLYFLCSCSKQLLILVLELYFGNTLECVVITMDVKHPQ